MEPARMHDSDALKRNNEDGASREKRKTRKKAHIPGRPSCGGETKEERETG